MEIDQIDEESFASLLKSLGVETYGVSFGWMLDDDEYGILKWIFENIDHKNALTTRESYRLSELIEENLCPTKEQCTLDIKNLESKYIDIALPGDKQRLKQIEFKKKQLQERVNLLKQHEEQLDELIAKNEQVKEEISKENMSLKHSLSCVEVDLKKASKNCLTEAKTVENKIFNLIQNVAENFKFYSQFHTEKALSQHFLVAGPIEKFVQGRRLFRSHFDLYTLRQFEDEFAGRVPKNPNSKINIALEVKLLEERLQNAIVAYLDSVGQLSGLYKKIDLAMNYKEVRSSQLAISIAEHTAEVELLKRELFSREIDDSVSKRLAMGALLKDAMAKLDVRNRMYEKVCELSTIVRTATALDSLLYFALRRENARVQDFVEFATEVKRYVDEENAAISSRMALMSSVEQEIKESNEKIKEENYFYEIVNKLLGEFNYSQYPEGLPEVNAMLEEQKQIAFGTLEKMEVVLRKCDFATKELVKQLESSKSQINSCSESCRQVRESEIELDNTITGHAKKYTDMKTNKSDPQRKLWQLFVCDPAKFLSTIDEMMIS